MKEQLVLREISRKLGVRKEDIIKRVKEIKEEIEELKRKIEQETL
jgi:hypothetical protein